MAEDNRHNTDLSKLADGIRRVLQQAADAPPWLQKHKTGKWPAADLPELRTLTEVLSSVRARAEQEVDVSYQQRRDASARIVEQRRKRLEAYAKRDRKAIPKLKDRFIVAGRVIDKASGVGLPNVTVRAFDQQREFVDRLGGTRTDALGYFRIDYTADFIEKMGDGNPEIFMEVLGENGEVLFTSPKPFVQQVGKSEYVDAHVLGDKVPVSLEQSRKVDRSINRRREEFERRERILRR